jgi:hypothetical protein
MWFLQDGRPIFPDMTIFVSRSFPGRSLFALPRDLRSLLLATNRLWRRIWRAAPFTPSRMSRCLAAGRGGRPDHGDTLWRGSTDWIICDL